MSAIKRSVIHLSADKALGVFGGGLAAASLGFGVYMNIHGPAASFGHSKDFTVFAQFAAPRAPKIGPGDPIAGPEAGESLDMTATASISATVPDRNQTSPDAGTALISNVTLEAASVDAATILVDGHAQTVHIGDTVPHAGEVLEIRPGPQPSVKTSRGLIVSSRQP